MMKNKFIAIFTIILLLSSCSNSKVKDHIEYDLPDVEYTENIALKKLPEVKNIDSMQDLSNFIDYAVFYNQNEDFVYTNVTDAYKKVLLDDLDYQINWAAQYATIGHNFVKNYDASKLDENLIGISGYIFDYGFKYYEEKANNIITFEYYQDVLSKNTYQNNDISNLPLYQNNDGFVEVTNSEQLFYVCMKNYFPYCKKETKAYEILQKATGILNRIIKKDMTELEKYIAIYHYILSETTYDYSSFKQKDSVHQDYACYFLEGVFDHHTAVCDGLTKALVLFSRLEGIEAYHIGALSNIGGHAYCYVKINDNYYLSCPTSGSSIETKNNIKYYVHNNLYMLTSYYTSSPSWDYSSEAFPNIKQEVLKSNPFPYYDNYYITIDNEKYSLHIEDFSTGNKILNFVENVAKENNLCLQIELLGSYEIMSNIWQNYSDKDNLNFVNNGILSKEKAYAFFFDFRK